MTTEVALQESADRRMTAVPLGKPLDNLLQAVILSNGLIQADLIPDSLKKNPKDILAVLVYGSELGLQPMQSVQGIYVVKGRPMLSAQLWRALVARAHHRLKVVESTNLKAIVEITRGDDGVTFREEFTLEDAENAGLVSIKDGKALSRSPRGEKLPWEQWTRAMLRYRALVFCARIACPEVAFNAGIHGEEWDEPDAPDLRPGAILVEQVIETSDVDKEDAVVELATLAEQARAEHLVPSEAELAVEDAVLAGTQR